ncbi:alpha/beta fold hydrolase [Priestia megaterium]|uniref:alpha/beta fold hydrolase n=1 Tax=Priestia megaterium TaxID=1404 RepID=UPI000762A01D|nr:alpha/beta hydrolase [Priestia megaterium]KWU55825.1 alpha/beta hydrolase [Priestia megaterium]
MTFIETNTNHYLYYEEYGQGAPVIFIHPPGLGYKVFQYQHELSKHMRVIFPDLSGHGRSSKPKQPISISFYANELVRFMDSLHLHKVIICGYSAGCLIAQELAIHYRHRIELLILSGAYPIVRDVPGRLLHKTGMYMVKEHPNMLITSLAISHTRDKTLRKNLVSYMRKSDQESWYQYYNHSLHYNCVDKLHRLTMPLLFIYGGKKDWTAHYMKEYKNKCKHAEFFVLPNQGHQLPTKQWTQFNELITGFVLNKSHL